MQTYGKNAPGLEKSAMRAMFLGHYLYCVD